MLRKTSASPYQYYRSVSEVHVHPEFVLDTLLHDIALLRLERPLHFGKHVAPVCLPGKQKRWVGWAKEKVSV